jgi:UDP-4-amino-4,6-dideoxy-N-acetyl-beta-L-altrosamine transaminase
MIPYGRQSISQADIDAVTEVLRSDFLTQGPVVPRFESVVASYCGSAHGVAVNSATSALHLACLALGVGSGDLVWTSPITFVASANCALYCGAEVGFVDIEPQTFTISPAALADKLVAAEKAGRLPKVVIAVHLCGQSCDMKAIAELAGRYGFRIIEDASHAIGARYRDEPVGSCRFSDITVFSFHPVKIITSGEGGLATTNNQALARKMQLLRSHGITRNQDEMTEPPHGPWYYQQIALGFNYRMTDMQAALALSQLDRLDEFVSRRHAIADRYDELLSGLPLECPQRSMDCYSAFHLYVIRLHDSTRHRSTFEALRDGGIGVNLHYIPVHLQPWYRDMGHVKGDYPEAERYYCTALSLPIFPALTRRDLDMVATKLGAVLA